MTQSPGAIAAAAQELTLRVDERTSVSALSTHIEEHP